MLQHSITKDEIMMIANEFVQGLDPQQKSNIPMRTIPPHHTPTNNGNYSMFSYSYVYSSFI